MLTQVFVGEPSLLLKYYEWPEGQGAEIFPSMLNVFTA